MIYKEGDKVKLKVMIAYNPYVRERLITIDYIVTIKKPTMLLGKFNHYYEFKELSGEYNACCIETLYEPIHSRFEILDL